MHVEFHSNETILTFVLQYLKERVAVCEPISSTVALTQSLPRREFESISFDSELFALSSSPAAASPIHTSDPPALLFVLPRYYRDVSMGDEELVPPPLQYIQSAYSRYEKYFMNHFCFVGIFFGALQSCYCAAAPVRPEYRG